MVKDMIKAVLLRLVPRSAYLGLRRRYRALRDLLALARAQAYDLRLYARGSGLLRPQDPQVLKAHILKSYHRIEKGLALPVPKPGFGADAVRLLLDDLASYLSQGHHDWVAGAALQTLHAYVLFNQQAGVGGAAMAAVAAEAAALQQRYSGQATQPGGTLPVTRAALLAASQLPFGAFVRSRHSVRQFAGRPVERALIEQAVSDARYAPSVCNRSSGMVYLVDDPQRMQELLRHQNGNRGFGDSAAALLVVATRQATFLTVGERYQGWIDGGLFGMTLVYALHAQGLGSCCLNWSVEPAADRAFKQAAGIPAGDLVIMLLAVGHLPEQLVVARSARRPLDEVLVHLGPARTE